MATFATTSFFMDALESSAPKITSRCPFDKLAKTGRNNFPHLPGQLLHFGNNTWLLRRYRQPVRHLAKLIEQRLDSAFEHAIEITGLPRP